MNQSFFIKLLNLRNIGTLFFLALPLFGLWMAIDGLASGPNYSKVQVVVIEDVETIINTTTSGPRMFPTSTSTWTELVVHYHFNDLHGALQQGEITVLPQKILPENQTPGGQALLEVPVNRADGVFKLNRRVEVGLTLVLEFGLMGLFSVPAVRWRNNPAARSAWYQFGSLILGLIALVLWVV